MASGCAGKWGGQGKAYKHDVPDIVEGHSSFWTRLVFGMNMIILNRYGTRPKIWDYQASNATSYECRVAKVSSTAIKYASSDVVIPSFTSKK